ncbi:MAG: type II toxin-antitoxin system RelE/ParE family toxin [Candidatus Omnitrophica bacterium]|nr:type II toxin-antitoxin system RelE/ParE family toxin [Candidatus Omnitrophota bacterium]
MIYNLCYHPDVKRKDLPKIPKNLQKRIRAAIEKRLQAEPEKYGQPLKKGLRRYRKLRVGDYRVIYKINKKNIIIFKIGHRKEVYPQAQSRKRK